MSVYFIPLIAVPIYMAWCFYSAYKAKDRAAVKLENLLKKKDIDEQLKYVLVRCYDDGYKQFIAPKILLWSLTGRKKVDTSKREARKSFVSSVNELSERNREEYFATLAALVMVNVRYAPITYLAVLFIFGVIVTMRVVFGGNKGSLLHYLKAKVFSAEEGYLDSIAH